MFIYKITNITNQKCYVGSTKRPLKKRFKAHLYEARKNVDDMYLHRAMRKYGEINFQIELIEECVIETLYDREIYWIKKLTKRRSNRLLTADEIEVRIWAAVVLLISFILFFIVVAIIYRTTFVIQPIKAISPMDLADQRMLNDIVLLIVGGVGGVP